MVITCLLRPRQTQYTHCCPKSFVKTLDIRVGNKDKRMVPVDTILVSSLLLLKNGQDTSLMHLKKSSKYALKFQLLRFRGVLLKFLWKVWHIITLCWNVIGLQLASNQSDFKKSWLLGKYFANCFDGIIWEPRRIN